MSRERALLVNLALSAVTCLAGAGALEGWARWREAHLDPAGPRGEAARPPGLPDGRPDASGFRDRQRTRDTPAGWRRVAVLGDSVTHGYRVPAELAYPQQLEALLEQRGHRVEVLNAARPGWSTREERLAWTQLRDYRPERVLLAVCLNDLPALQQGDAPPWLRWLHGRSALVRSLVDAPRRELGSVRQMFLEPDAAATQRAFAGFEQELAGLRQAVEADGARLAIVVFPYRFQVLPGAPAPSVQRRLRDLSERQGLPFLDLLPFLQELGPSGFQDVCHLTPVGLARVARALADSGLLGATAASAPGVADSNWRPSGGRSPGDRGE